MNNTVGAFDIRFNHLGIVDHNRSVFNSDGDVLSVDGLCGIKVHHIGRHDFAGDDMVGENAFELFYVIQ